LDQLEPGSAAYNMPAAVRLVGRLAVSVLAASLREIVRRHEVLRTTFATDVAGPVQVVAPPSPVVVPEVDLISLGARQRDEEAQRLTAEEACRPFALSRGPLFRVKLLRLGIEGHLVLLTQHHIVSDGWSISVLVRELGALYSAFAEGQPSPLAELSIQYADYAVWQREWLTGEMLNSQVAYWRERLEGAPALLELPIDRPRPPVSSLRGGRVTLALPAEGPRALARRQGVTLFMALLAGVAVLLSRLSGQEDLSVGSPIAGRSRRETEDLIGFFVNTLVLRMDLTGNPSFKELLERVREVSLGAYAHQDLPFEKLVEELSPERSLAHSPLFQVMVMLQNAPLKTLNLPGLELSPLVEESGAAKFDLTLTLTEVGQDLAGLLEYARDLFDVASMVRLVGQLERVLLAMAAEPEWRIGDLSLLSAAEQQQLLEWNDTGACADLELCLHELIEAQVERTPDAVAVEFEGKVLTYRGLNHRANQLAWRLRELGVVPEAPVGVCVERSLNLLVALLAVLKAGGLYVPLDPSYPQERLSFMLEDSKVLVLLTQGRQREKLPAVPDGAICLAVERAWGAVNGGNLRVWASPEQLAYVLYTSGSTGRPKGVAIPHKALVNFLESMRTRPGLSAADRLLAVTSLSFDISGLELYLPLLAGAQVDLVSREMAIDGARLQARLRDSGATVMQATPSTWQMMIDSGWQGKTLLKVLCGGEAMPENLSMELRQRADSVWNLYGPTETTVWSTLSRIEADGVTIGRPIENTGVVLLDVHLEPLPVGVPGELHIGGTGLARCYYGRPELTATFFVPNPYCGLDGEPGSRLYRTGDLARYLPDGRIEHLGRIDNQLKVRGFRIEPGEVETALVAHPAVGRVVVIAREERLVAFLVAREGQVQPTAADLRDSLSAALPDFMMPTVFIWLSELPLTPSGKVDRRTLARMRISAVAAERHVPPRNELECEIAALWREVLRVEQVGVEDNFFELGGHSLLATQVVSRLRAAFGIELPLRRLFESPTVSALAAAVETARSEGAIAAGPSIRRQRRHREMPLSFAQERLWFLDQLEPGSTAYNIPAAVRLVGRLAVSVLAASLGEIVRRHEVLRTTFAVGAAGPVQVVAPPPPVIVPEVDLTGLGQRLRDEEAQRLTIEETRRPFDLSRGPLLRVKLLSLGSEEHLVLLTQHHIVSDAWSTGVFTRELGALYSAFAESQPSPLPGLAIQYADYASWQREWLRGEILERQVAYWRERLAGAPLLDLPTDRPRQPGQARRGARQEVALPRALSPAVAALCRSQGMTTFMALLAAFKVLLFQSTGQSDMVVGINVANRNYAETAELIGFFINQLVLRTDLSGDPKVTELLRRVREVALGAYAHQDLPFEGLVQELEPEREKGQPTLFRVKLDLLNVPVDPIEIPGLLFLPCTVEWAVARYDLHLSLTETEQGIRGELLYDAELFDSATAARLVQRFELILTRMVERPQARLSELVEFLERTEQEERRTRTRARVETNLKNLRKIARRSVTQQGTSPEPRRNEIL
jgi:amino acid adenylation domain-containing protein